MSRFSASSLFYRIATLQLQFGFGQSGADVMSVCRSERVRPRLTALALAGLLLGQTLVPCGMLLSSVRAAEVQRAEKTVAPNSSMAPLPAWAKNLEKRTMEQGRAQNLRLAQFDPKDKSQQKGSAASADLDCLDCEVDIAPLDLSEVPTEQALRRAGGTEGALYPMRRADPAELGLKLDRLLKKVGVDGGLRGQLLPKTRALSA